MYAPNVLRPNLHAPVSRQQHGQQHGINMQQHGQQRGINMPADYGASENDHFVLVPGGSIDRSAEYPKGRYVCESMLGTGIYGRVIKAFDQKHKAWIAVKVVRRSLAYQVLTRLCALGMSWV